LQKSLDRIESKIDKMDRRINSKLDNHLGRISTLEESVVWIKGHVKITITIGITVVAALLGIITNYINK
jgi:hypothetical protein